MTETAKKSKGPMTDLSAIKRINAILSQLPSGTATRVLNFVAEGFHEKRQEEHAAKLEALTKQYEVNKPALGQPFAGGVLCAPADAD